MPTYKSSLTSSYIRARAGAFYNRCTLRKYLYRACSLSFACFRRNASTNVDRERRTTIVNGNSDGDCGDDADDAANAARLYSRRHRRVYRRGRRRSRSRASVWRVSGRRQLSAFCTLIHERHSFDRSRAQTCGAAHLFYVAKAAPICIRVCRHRRRRQLFLTPRARNRLLATFGRDKNFFYVLKNRQQAANVFWSTRAEKKTNSSM